MNSYGRIILTSIWMVSLLVFCAPAALAAVAFAPPDDSVDAANELKGIERELADRNYASAAKRIDALLGAKVDPLVDTSGGTLTAVSAWVDALEAGQRRAL